MFRLMLADKTIIGSNDRRVPFNIAVNNMDVTETLVTSIAFGILLEQKYPADHNSHSPDITAPFGYFSIEGLIDQQDSKPGQCYRILHDRVDQFGQIQADNLVEETNINETLAHTIMLGMLFGTAIEGAGFENVELPEHVADEIYGSTTAFPEGTFE
jgi:hypothetical protein